jgi:MoaA/NifB/PqqE/SkfB family radical SAM enzyme
MQANSSFETETHGLKFLWLELTSRCNLRCIHCYAESEPVPEKVDKLSAAHYHKLIDSAASLGCRQIQFIGGEPTLNPALPELIKHARTVGFAFIEVFTNATRIPKELLRCFVENEVSIATSFYSNKAVVHDSITKKPGSFSSTVGSIKKLVAAKVPLRAGIIVMEENKETTADSVTFLKSIGVENVGLDRVRTFGRGADRSLNRHESPLSELCGSCWRGSVCVSPEGSVAPCIMAKNWSVGSVLDTELAAIVQSPALKKIRKRIHDEVWLPSLAKQRSQGGIHSSGTTENENCGPGCFPNCVPGCNPQCSPNCQPCYPYGKCNPELFGGCNPCSPSS